MLGDVLNTQELLTLATSIEGHPDNVAPALLGGLTSSVFEDGVVYSVKRDVDESLCFAAIVPDYKLLTEAARAALPKEVTHKDAVYNLSRAALIPAAFCEGRHDLLAIATEDKLHQPYRMPLMPGSKEVFDMARLCGAKAVYVSGAGSTVMAVAEKANAEKFYSKLEKGLELLEGLDGCEAFTLLRLDADTTDDLIAKAAEITHNPSAREMDMLLAAGEEISIALLAMALNELGCHATSLTGWQAGFRTDRAYTKARITKLETERISSELERNRVVVVAGFQGLNKLDDITTLGRGGSDTSAVAIAAALHADRCQIFTDVEGVYTADPRKVRNTRKLDEITFDEMLELASLGAQVLNNRSVELAKKYNVELEVLSSLNPVPGTVVKEVVKDVEGMLIKGVAKDTDVAVITILNVPDEPGTSFKIFGLLAQKNINVDIILQSTGREGKKDISFTCAESEAETALRVLRESAKFDQVTCDETCAKVSIVGAGMQSHSGVASKMFEALSNNNINIKMISTSEIKISCIIDREDADKAVSAIHDMLFE